MDRIAGPSGLKNSLGLSLGERIAEARSAGDGAAGAGVPVGPAAVLDLLAGWFDGLDGLDAVRPGAPRDGVVLRDLEPGRGPASFAEGDADPGPGAFDLSSLLKGPDPAESASVDLSGGYGALGGPTTGLGGAPGKGGAAADKGPIELLVQFHPGANAAQVKSAAAALGGGVVETIHTSVMADAGSGMVVRMTFGQGLSLEKALEIAGRLPGVTLAEPNWGIGVEAASNDPYFTNGSLWGMYSETSSSTNPFGSQAYDAWAAGHTGSSGAAPSKTVVGVIDSGIDYTHPDLYLNIWINQLEISSELRTALDYDGDGQVTFRDLNRKDGSGAFLAVTSGHIADANANGRIDAHDLLKGSVLADGADTDGNGRIDDLVGWDFANNDNDPFDDYNHGTHVAGTIGASGGNGTGVAGVAWDVLLMPLKFLSAAGSGPTSAAIQAVDYFTAASRAAALAGVDQDFAATNNSWGGGGYSSLLLQSITEGAKQDVLFVASAGNGGADGVGDNNDVLSYFPANYDTTAGAGYDAVIAVASLTSTGAISSFSNYGKATVELGAPGSSIWSTLPGALDPSIANSGSYGNYSGTSMAAPHVAGAIALYASLFPDATAAQIRDALLASTVSTASLADRTLSGGRLDVATLLGGTPTPPAPDTTPPVVTGVTYGTHDGTLRAGETVTLTVALNEAVVVNASGGAPTLSLNAGGMPATFVAGSSTPTTLVFSYTVQPGEGAADLAVTAFNLNGATIRDAAGNAANLSGAAANPGGTLAVDTGAPTLSVSASRSSLAAGETAQVTFQFSEAVSGFDASDVTFSGGQISNFRQGASPTSFVVDVTAGQQGGTFSVGVAPGGANPVPYTDLAGNAGGTGSVALTVTSGAPSFVFGTGGSDARVWSGVANANEVISGLAKGSTSLGGRTVDTLVGNGGNDVFVFGDSRGHYYDDGNRKTASASDYALVTDFAAGDTIQLHGTASKYLLADVTVGGVRGAGIHVDKNANLRLDSQDELIGVIRDALASSLSLTDGTFQFVVSDALG